MVGGVRKIEWTWSADGGIHLHAHLAVWGKYVPQKLLRDKWNKATKGAGQIVDIRRIVNPDQFDKEMFKWKKAGGTRSKPVCLTRLSEYFAKDIPEGKDSVKFERLCDLLHRRRLIEPLGLFRRKTFARNDVSDDGLVRMAVGSKADDVASKFVKRVENRVQRERNRVERLQRDLLKVQDGDESVFSLWEQLQESQERIALLGEEVSIANWVRYKRPAYVRLLIEELRRWMEWKVEREKKRKAEMLARLRPCRHCGCEEWEAVADEDDLSVLIGKGLDRLWVAYKLRGGTAERPDEKASGKEETGAA
jgi:hypothetical protein